MCDKFNFKSPILYILMRNDLYSLNSQPGKVAAQSAHAANKFTHKMSKIIEKLELKDKSVKDLLASEQKDDILTICAFKSWSTCTDQGFGTTIVLGAKMHDIYKTIEVAAKMNFVCDTVYDPTYPLEDGEIIHKIPLHTCGFIFGEKENLSVLLRQFQLFS